MKVFLSRGTFLFILFSLFTAALLSLFWGWVNLENWKFLMIVFYAQIPIGAWIILILLLISFGLSLWSLQITKSKESEFEKVLRPLLDVETLSIESPKHSFSNRLNNTLHSLNLLIITQRKSLLRISNERAEAQDKIIAERIVQERQRLARELHDSVSQQLFAASMLLSAMTETEKETNGVVPKSLGQVESIVQQAQLEMRALLLHLRPAALNNKSLTQGLEELLMELQQKVYFTIKFRLEDVSLSKGAEDHLFRIAQETLSNTLRHAKATEVDVLFVERDGLAIFRVQDNGVGFEQSEGKMGSYGLQNVMERAVEIGGTCKVVSVPSQGTIVEVKMPVMLGEELDDTSVISG